METKLNGYILKILPDEDPINPRKEWEHLGTLLAWHRRYDLGDNNDYPEPEDFWQSEEAKHLYVSVPVYLLDHSGLRVSCSPFTYCDPGHWDSGQLGFIYCTKERAAEWFSNENVSEDTVRQTLYREIEEYDAYLNGSYFGFLIEGLNGDIEDSCWGFPYNGDIHDLVNDMKDSVTDEYLPLFDKLAAQEKAACM